MAGPNETAGLADFLQAYDQAQNFMQRQKFIQDRAALGSNPSADDLTSLALRYLAPKDMVTALPHLSNKDYIPIGPQGLYEKKTGMTISPREPGNFQDIKPVTGGYLQKKPDGTYEFTQTKDATEKNPLIQPNFPISNTEIQPHISNDQGKTWTPLPGSSPRPLSTAPQAAPNDIEVIAKAIASYNQAPMTGFALRAPGAQKIMSRVMELNPQYNAQQYAISQKTRNSFSTGVEGRTTRSFNVAIDHLDTLKDAADALQNGDIKRFNQLAQRTAEETGSNVPTDFNAVKGIVAKEIVKSVVGNATAGGVTERQELERELSRANSPAQLNGMIKRYQMLMAGQLKGLKKQYESGYGGSDFEERFLLPRSKEVFKSMQQEIDKRNSVPNNAPPPPAGFKPL